MDWNELRAFYRPADHRRATLDNSQSGRRERTRTRTAATPHRVLVIHDTTELDFADHPAVPAELGPIGTGEGVGLPRHNSLAFDPEGERVVGLIDRRVERRQPRPKEETRRQRALRPHKESRLWLEGLRGVGRTPAGSRWIDVCDRGADYFEAMRESRRLGHDFLIRVRQDRRVSVAEADEETGEAVGVLPTPHEAAAAVKGATTKEASAAGKGGRPGRAATVRVGCRLPRPQPPQPPQPDGRRRGMASMAVTLARVGEAGASEARAAAKEANAPFRRAQAAVKTAEAEAARAKGKAKPQATAAALPPRSLRDEAEASARQKARQANEYLDRWLATSCPAASIADALPTVSDYEWRWPAAEEYHKVEKSGLRIGRQRFETAAALTAALATLAAAAVRLLQLRYARDEQPQADAREAATAEEIAMAAKATNFTGATMTVKQFVDCVARLGGYLGRKCDGLPGWSSLWRGRQRLADLLLGLRFSQTPTEFEPMHNDPD